MAEIAIGTIRLQSSFGLAPMAGMTDTAFRRLVKRKGGCGLVVTEMVSSEGLVRGIDRTLEYAEYTEDERPVAIQIFGGDPATMAEAACIVEGMGADIVDVNMGCPVPKISRHHAGCGLMQEPAHAAAIVRAMVDAVRVPVTVKMRAGWNDQQINAPSLARMMQEAGAAAVTVHGRTAAQGYRGSSNWELIGRVAAEVDLPVLGSGDCVEPVDLVDRPATYRVAGVLVGRGALRNPWIFAQAAALEAGQPLPPVTPVDRGQFLLDYVDLLLDRQAEAQGFRHLVPTVGSAGRTTAHPPARGRERWVINKLRALAGWYTKGLEHGGGLRVAINQAESISQLADIIAGFFFSASGCGPHACSAPPPLP